MSEVRNNQSESRYELEVEGHVAVAEYRLSDGVVTFTHTAVPSELGGKGVGGKLVKGALDDVRANGQKVVAQCAFVAGYIDKHPDEQNLLA